MTKYISFLLVPIMMFGISSNSCYSMSKVDGKINIKKAECDSIKLHNVSFYNQYTAHMLYSIMGNKIDEKKDITISDIIFNIKSMYSSLEDYSKHYYDNCHYNRILNYDDMRIQKFEQILDKPILYENQNYLEYGINTLNDLKNYSYRIQELQTQNYIEVIKILTDIDISDIIKSATNHPDHDTIRQNVKNILNNIGKGKIEPIIEKMDIKQMRAKMKMVIKLLKLHYLPELSKIKKQIINITTYLAEKVYNTNDVYQTVFSRAYEENLSHFNKCESKLDSCIRMMEFFDFE